MCGKGIISIDTFHTIRVLSNFAGLAGYATFPARRLPARDHFYYCNYIEPKALIGISVESAQGLFLNYGTRLKCHFYDLIVFT